jgi:hypothetical protein
MSTRIRTRALAAFFAVTTGALVLIAGPAQAESKENPAEACWLNADSGVVRCFADEEALQDAVATSGRVLIEEDSAVAARSDADLRASYVIARFYDGGSYSGATFVVSVGSSTACASGTVSGDLLAFNDKVSSFHSYFGCTTRIFQHTGGGGSFFGYISDAASVAPLNNQASSYSIT